MFFVGGVGHGTKTVLARALIQERVPERLHGRAFAAYNGLRNGAELVTLAGACPCSPHSPASRCTAARRGAPFQR